MHDAYEATRAWRALAKFLNVRVLHQHDRNIAPPAIRLKAPARSSSSGFLRRPTTWIFGAFMLPAGSLGDKADTPGRCCAFTAASLRASPRRVPRPLSSREESWSRGLSITMTLASHHAPVRTDCRRKSALTMNAVAMTLGAPFGLVLGGVLVISRLRAISSSTSRRSSSSSSSMSSSCRGSAKPVEPPAPATAPPAVRAPQLPRGTCPVSAGPSTAPPPPTGLVGLMVAGAGDRGVRPRHPVVEGPNRPAAHPSFAAASLSLPHSTSHFGHHVLCCPPTWRRRWEQRAGGAIPCLWRAPPWWGRRYQRVAEQLGKKRACVASLGSSLLLVWRQGVSTAVRIPSHGRGALRAGAWRWDCPSCRDGERVLQQQRARWIRP